jgi:N4-gp56 family major capsid protein
MSVDIFKPEIWSARLRRHLDRKLVYAQPQVSNRDWEGEIADAGDTVHIQKVGDPTILDYVPGNDLAAPERPDGDTLALVVDQFKAFNVAIDDVDAAQVNVNLLDAFANRAGVKMAQKVDAFVAGVMVAASTVNTVGSQAAPVHVEADGSAGFTPYELAVELRRQLADHDAPLDSLWLAINADLEAEFLKDPRFLSIADYGRPVVQTGEIGQVAGFSVLRTTGVPVNGSVKKVLAGAGNYATTFADQLTKLEAYRIERQFGDAVKGLEIFGAKVLEPETLALANVGFIGS